MEWVIGFFILWLIGTLLGGSSKSKNDSSTTRYVKKKEDIQKANIKPLEDLSKRLAIDLDGASSKNTRKFTPPSVSADLPPVRPKPDEKLLPRNEVLPWLEDDSCPNITNALNQYGVASVWHMTHKNNIREILRSGILSNKTAYETKNPLDISDHGVQRWRELKDPIHGRKLHEYAPTYINIKNPMLYVRRDIQHDLCLIEISLSVLLDNNFIFTDGNAAARNTNFYKEANDLDKLPWDVLNASYWNNFPDGKRKRCSEILIYPKVEKNILLSCIVFQVRLLTTCLSLAFRWKFQKIYFSESVFRRNIEIFIIRLGIVF